jgi:hypothetical protein
VLFSEEQRSLPGGEDIIFGHGYAAAQYVNPARFRNSA